MLRRTGSVRWRDVEKHSKQKHISENIKIRISVRGDLRYVIYTFGIFLAEQLFDDNVY